MFGEIWSQKNRLIFFSLLTFFFIAAATFANICCLQSGEPQNWFPMTCSFCNKRFNDFILFIERGKIIEKFIKQLY